MNRADVFHTQQDREVYLALVQEHVSGAGVSVFAYCFMSNHVHWIVKPAEEHSLALLFQRVHGRYAQYFNPLRRRTGHLWQNRYFSCPLSQSHLKIAVRYVEWNPVRAGLAEQPEAYKWSSAAAHLSGPANHQGLSLDWDTWNAMGGAAYWRELLETPPDIRHDQQIRRCSYSGKPFGDVDFVAEFEARFGRQWRNPGRPKKVVSSAETVPERYAILSAGN